MNFRCLLFWDVTIEVRSPLVFSDVLPRRLVAHSGEQPQKAFYPQANPLSEQSFCRRRGEC